MVGSVLCVLSLWKGELQQKDLNPAPPALALPTLVEILTQNDLQVLTVLWEQWLALYFCFLSLWKRELQQKDLNLAPPALAFHTLEDVSTANELQGCHCSFVFSLFSFVWPSHSSLCSTQRCPVFAYFWIVEHYSSLN